LTAVSVASWVDQYRAIWETRFDQLDAYLQQLSTDHPTSDREGDPA
jgi:hypothetical protein